MPLLQSPDQIQRLVGGNAAADDQGDAGDAGNGVRAVAGRSRRRRRQAGRGWGGLRPALNELAQDDPDFLLDRASVASRAQPQLGLDGLIEFPDGQTGHVSVPPRMVAVYGVLSLIARN